MTSIRSKLPSFVNIAVFKNILLFLFIYRHTKRFTNILKIRGILGSSFDVFSFVKSTVFKYVRKYVPGVEKEINKQVSKSVRSIQSKLVPAIPTAAYVALPTQGLTTPQIRAELIKYKNLEVGVDWKHGRVSGAIYHGGAGGDDEFSGLLTEAYGMFNLANPLHPEIFPGVRQMESEIISMTLNMYNAPSSGCGTVTSGGTESLLLAVKTYRDMAWEKRGVSEPEIVVPVTVHAAIDKACEYFKVKLIHVPILSSGKVDVKYLSRCINSNTIAIVGSAPNFPHGIVDNIPALSKIALKHKIPLHVDACLGGFLVPFLDKAGFPLDHDVDFQVEGVTSISVDPHKYGFAPKGSSVILYRSKEIRNYQYFITTDWPGGVYASPSIAGSRPGALIAGCWTAMIKMGESGYVKATKDIVGCARKISNAIEKIPQLELIGLPKISVVSFRYTAQSKLKIFYLADLLSQKGWHLNIIQFPEAIHIACTLLTISGVDDLIRDIKESVELMVKEPNSGNGELAAIYGTAASVPDCGIIKDVCRGFLDALTLMPEVVAEK